MIVGPLPDQHEVPAQLEATPLLGTLEGNCILPVTNGRVQVSWYH